MPDVAGPPTVPAAREAIEGSGRHRENPVFRPLIALVASACCVALGCAHNKANQYAYAPPLAPPVYPQPQQSMQPVAYPAPAALPPGAVMPPGTVVAPGAAAPPMVPPTTSAGVVPAMPDGSCPACPSGCDGQHGVMPVAYESAVQTPPCPQGQ